jgi:hypothetical protein
MDNPTQIFVVEAGQEFVIQIRGPETSVADPAGCINGITYRYKATTDGLIQLGQAYRSVPKQRPNGLWILERVSL